MVATKWWLKRPSRVAKARFKQPMNSSKKSLNERDSLPPIANGLCQTLPGQVAVVTSATGAVIRDIIHVATRRFPQAQILVIPARVQGPESAPSILKGLSKPVDWQQSHGLSALIVGRGGGSLEDLWGFNDERVARAIVRVPFLSSVRSVTRPTLPSQILSPMFARQHPRLPRSFFVSATL